MPAPNDRSSRQALSREKVLKTALRLADKQGIDSLSMRKLADALDVEAMSLYNHIKNKDEVIDGIVEMVVNRFTTASFELPWKQAMRECAISTHQVLLKHPWVAMLLISRVTICDGLLRYSDASFGCLRKAGFSYEMADHGWNAISNHIYGFTLTVISAPIDSSEYSNAAEHYLSAVPKEQYPHVHSLMTLIISGEHTGINDFEFGLDLILDGLERLAEK